jgi:glycine/D-amino acid oxidase-like deaminating enzyme
VRDVFVDRVVTIGGCVKIKVVLLCALAWLPLYALAAEWKPLAGTYAVTGASAVDPPPGESQTSHFRVQLTGASARDLFFAIPGSAVTDECTGGQSKSAGQLRCLYFKDGDSYECAFAIDLLDNEIDYGVVC